MLKDGSTMQFAILTFTTVHSSPVFYFCFEFRQAARMTGLPRAPPTVGTPPSTPIKSNQPSYTIITVSSMTSADMMV
jgi:hypothetical protein